LIVRRIVKQLEVLREAIAEHDKTLVKMAQSHPDYGIFSSLPGAAWRWHPGRDWVMAHVAWPGIRDVIDSGY